MWEVGESKKNAATARFHLFFTWTFRKGVKSYLVTCARYFFQPMKSHGALSMRS
jgi:hypothetical protein